MARLTFFGLLALAGILAGGCVVPAVREIPHVEREPLGEIDGGLAVARERLDGATLTLRLDRVTRKRFKETVTIERVAEYQYHSAAAAAFYAPEPGWMRVAVLPLVLIGGAFDVAGWVLTAPWAYPSAAISARDGDPESREVTELDRQRLAAGVAVTVAPTGGIKAAAVQLQTGADGAVSIDLDPFATAALEAGQEFGRLDLAVAGSPAKLELVLTLEQLLDAAAVRAERDPELRSYQWRRLYDSCPPEAARVRAAIKARMDTPRW